MKRGGIQDGVLPRYFSSEVPIFNDVLYTSPCVYIKYVLQNINFFYWGFGMGVLLQSACLILSLLYYEDQSGTIFENFHFVIFKLFYVHV